VGVNLFFGQNGFFGAALIVGAMRELDRRPVLAGACLGLLSMKPQLGILFPVALILSGRWRCLAAAAVTAAVLVIATGAVFGFEIWADYFTKVMPYQNKVMTAFHGPYLAMMPTAYAVARVWDTGNALAWLMQAPFTLYALGAVVWTCWKRRDRVVSIAVLITASITFTPYVFVYDMVVMGWVLALVRPRLTARWDWSLSMAIWLLPAAAIVFGFRGQALAPVLIIMFLARLLMVLRADEAAKSPATPWLFAGLSQG